MTGLLLYGYCQGVASSRKIEKATHESVPFRVLSANQHPDHDTIAEFRRRHLGALSGLFVQVYIFVSGRVWCDWVMWRWMARSYGPMLRSTRR
jgi:transposase